MVDHFFSGRVKLECKVIHYLDVGSHTLVVGEIIETYLFEDYLTNGKVDPGKIDPLIYNPWYSQISSLGHFQKCVIYYHQVVNVYTMKWSRFPHPCDNSENFNHEKQN